MQTINVIIGVRDRGGAVDLPIRADIWHLFGQTKETFIGYSLRPSKIGTAIVHYYFFLPGGAAWQTSCVRHSGKTWFDPPNGCWPMASTPMNVICAVGYNQCHMCSRIQSTSYVQSDTINIIRAACPQPRPVLPPGVDLNCKQCVKLNRLHCGTARVGDTSNSQCSMWSWTAWYTRLLMALLVFAAQMQQLGLGWKT